MLKVGDKIRYTGNGHLQERNPGEVDFRLVYKNGSTSIVREIRPGFGDGKWKRPPYAIVANVDSGARVCIDLKGKSKMKDWEFVESK